MTPYLCACTCLGTGNSACGSWDKVTFLPLSNRVYLQCQLRQRRLRNCVIRRANEGGIPGSHRPTHPSSTFGTCAIRLGVCGLHKLPAFPLCLLHLWHVEISLPCQWAHEMDLVLLVDLQPRVSTQLPLLPVLQDECKHYWVLTDLSHGNLGKGPLPSPSGRSALFH